MEKKEKTTMFERNRQSGTKNKFKKYLNHVSGKQESPVLLVNEIIMDVKHRNTGV